MLADLVLVGFGNVGRRFARLIDERRDQLQRDWELTCRVTGIATRRHGVAYNARGLDVREAAELVEANRSLGDLRTPGARASPDGALEVIAQLARSRASMRVLVETTTLDIASGQPAIDHVRAALSAGLHAVTANKAPAAFAYHDLSAVATRAGVSFLFEGAVMDGVPIFNLVRETLPTVSITGFRGVVNSTTNHILTAIEDGEAFEPALARMQEAGIAEADATLDVDGWDAAAKAAALANVLLGARISPHDVDRTGIGPEWARRAREAKSNGRCVRLVASAERHSRAVVRPTELTLDDPLAGLRGMANALVLTTDTLGDIVIFQRDGGLTQTAYALLSDLITIRRRV